MNFRTTDPGGLFIFTIKRGGLHHRPPFSIDDGKFKADGIFFILFFHQLFQPFLVHGSDEWEK